MNDRVKTLLADKMAKDAARAAEVEQRRLIEERKEAAQKALLIEWQNLLLMVQAALDRMNAQTSDHGIAFVGQEAPNRQGAFRSFLVSESSRTYAYNVLALKEDGRVFAGLYSNSVNPPKATETTIKGVDDQFLDEWLADILESHIHPGKKAP